MNTFALFSWGIPRRASSPYRSMHRGPAAAAMKAATPMVLSAEVAASAIAARAYTPDWLHQLSAIGAMRSVISSGERPVKVATGPE